MQVILRRNIFANGARIKKGPNGASVFVPESLRPFIEKIKDAVIVEKAVAPKQVEINTLRDFDHVRAEAEALEALQEQSNIDEEIKQSRRYGKKDR